MEVLRLGDLLKSKDLIDDNELKVAMAQQGITGEMLGDTIIKLGFVSSREMAQALSEQAKLEFLGLESYSLSEDALRLVSHDIAEKMGFLPLAIEKGILSIGITNPSNIIAIDTAARISGKPPKTYMVDTESFYNTLERAYYFLEHPIHKRIMDTVNEIKSGEAPSAVAISSLTELFLQDGIRREATDVHINPALQTVNVFYRIDGVLQHGYCLPKAVQNGITSRIKVLSQLDIAEHRLPQDGSFSFDFLSKKYDMRVSTIPAIYGENVVLRILGGSGQLLNLKNLGFDERNTESLSTLFSKPYGIILVTGPTGSGKTTTLYAALREINFLEKNVLTVEDPVEYKLSMIKQTQINEKAGYDFVLAGRNFMRQDPDVMLLGEIRDEETAKIAIRAATTGHLVISTLHTNDAVTAIPRLLDLAVDKFMLAPSLLAVLAQRLLRKICLHCRTEYQVTEAELKKMGLEELAGEFKTAFMGTGCAACNNTGYRGRIAIGEILIVNDDIKDLIYVNASVRAIKDAAIKNGMKTFRDDGIKKALAGITTLAEVLRVAG